MSTVSMSRDARFWDRLAAKYAAQPIADVPAWEKKLAITIGALAPTDRVLNVGCGTGSLSLELAPHAAETHGVDISESMLEIARAKVRDAGLDNAHFHHATLDDPLPFEAASFDVVCAYSILHLVADRPAVLRGLFEVLKPGGTFISSTVCLGDSWVPFRPLLATMHWLGKAPRVWIVGRATLADEMRAAGFVDVTLPDVGAKPIVAFATATKPG